MTSALTLTVVAWDLFYGVRGWPVVVVAISVTAMVAIPILLFITKLVSSLGQANEVLQSRSDAEGRLGRLLQTSYDEVYVVSDRTLKFVEVNRSALDNLGYTPDEIRNLTPLDLKPGLCHGEFESFLSPLRQGTEDTVVVEATHRRKDGSTYPVRIRVQYSPLESPPVFVAVAQDMTEWKNALNQLRRAKERAESANQAKSSFLANMSHELRTPLNAILGFSEVLKDEILGPMGSERYIQYASDIHDSGTHLLEVINGVLDIAKIESGEQDLDERSVDIGEMVDSCIRLAVADRKTSGLQVKTDVPENLPHVRVDALKIKQVLINLLSNAIKFTGDGGDIAIEARQLRSKDIELTVRDSGIGMSQRDIPVALSVFGQIDSSMSRRYQGTGLGLPLVKALVESHGGRLNIDSAVGQGTTVSFTIPGRRVDSPQPVRV